MYNASKKRINTSSVVYSILVSVLIYVGYYKILFRTLGDLTLSQSRALLIGMVVLSSLLGFAVDIKSNRNAQYLLNQIPGYALYMFISYLSIKKTIIIVSVIGGFIALIVFALIDYKKARRDPAMSLKRWIKRTAISCKTLICTQLSIMCLLIGSGAIVGASLIEPDIMSANSSDDTWAISQNIDMLVVLEEDRWSAADDIKTKVDTLQIVANIYRCEKKIPFELNVGVSNLDEGLCGYYDHSKHQIIISLDTVVNGTARECLNTLFHEITHAEQHAALMCFEEIDPKYKGLDCFATIRTYQQEFANYETSDHDFERYYGQFCEKEARDKAARETALLLHRISDY